MSRPLDVRQYADPQGCIVRGFNGNVLIASGTTVPADGSAGYSKGCLFVDPDAAAGAQVWINEGTETSAAFKALPSQAAASTAALAIAGTAAGKKIAAGVASVTGTGTVVTGLATVTAVFATVQSDFSLTNGIGCSATVGDQAGTPAAGSVILKVWKPTGSGDVTPIASAAAVSVNWLAFGT